MGRWYPAAVALLATSLVVSNIIAVRLIAIRLSDAIELTLPAAIVLFPIAYIVGDVLTEVYGYPAARRGIWIAFGCNLLAVVAIWLAGILPAASFWTAGVYENPEQADQAYRAILGFAPRLLVASFLAYLVGEFLNSFVLAKMKVRTEGRYLWMRTIGSTIVGQGADSLIFITVAFLRHPAPLGAHDRRRYSVAGQECLRSAGNPPHLLGGQFLEAVGRYRCLRSRHEFSPGSTLDLFARKIRKSKAYSPVNCFLADTHPNA